MAKPLKKFTVVLNTNSGYYEYQIKANNLTHAAQVGLETHEPGDNDEVTVVVSIKGWPETRLYG